MLNKSGLNDLGLKSRLLTCGATVALVTACAFAAPAFAQDATTTANTPANDDGTVVVVTGIRHGIEAAINVKKKSDDIVEAISAEDIGKLPDQSIAESIARLPGVTAQRLDGRADVISIRGLGPDFTVALLNGREQVSPNNNRSAEFDQYPAELLSGVEIYKTPDAGLVSQGIAGTADLQTVRPLAYGKRTFAVNVRGESNSLGALNAGTTANGNRESFSYIDQFFDKTLGVAFGYAHMESPTQAEKFNAWGYPQQPDGAYILGGSKSYVESNDLKRDGLMGVIEWKPNDQVHSTVDVYYSTFNNAQILRGIEIGLAQWGGDGAGHGIGVSNVQESGGLVTSYDASGTKGVVRNDEDARKDIMKAIGWNFQYKPDDQWTLTSDLSHSDVHRTDVVLENYAGTGPAGSGATDNFHVTVTPGQGATLTGGTINYADPSLIMITSSQGWGGVVTDHETGEVYPNGQMGYLNRPRVIDSISALRLSAKRVLNTPFVDSVEFGVNTQRRTKDDINDEWFLELPGGAASAPIPTAALVGSTSLAYLGLGSMVSYDPMYLINHGNYDLVANDSADVTFKSWHVQETVSTAFTKFNINSSYAGMPVTGNFGLQYVWTEQSSSARKATNSQSTDLGSVIAGGAKYGEWLPSLNLNFHLHDDMSLRLAIARTESRPRMDQLSAANEYSFNSGNCTDVTCSGATVNHSPWSGNAGNPELRPTIADSYDIDLEKYFGHKGYISLALFDKQLRTWIYDTQSVNDFTGYITQGGYTPVFNQGIVTTPLDLHGGYIRGLELTVNVPGDIISPLLDGFGVFASSSLTKSQITPQPGVTIAIPGNSTKVENITVYYEKYGFSARVSERSRSKFLAEVNGYGNGLTETEANGESVVDAQLGYEFKDGTLRGLSILAQANNITNEPFSTYNNNDPRQVIYYQKYGVTYLFGLNYKY